MDVEEILSPSSCSAYCAESAFNLCSAIAAERTRGVHCGLRSVSNCPPGSAVEWNKGISQASCTHVLCSGQPPDAVDQPGDDEKQEKQKLSYKGARNVSFWPADGAAAGTDHLSGAHNLNAIITL